MNCQCGIAVCSISPKADLTEIVFNLNTENSLSSNYYLNA